MRCKFILLCAAMTAGAAAGAERREIQIIRADVARNYRSGGLNISRLIGDVALLHNNTLMTCDSAYLYPDQRFEAFGSVAIHKDTTSLYGNYMDYRSAENLCKIRGKIVTLIDGQTRLRTQQIDFNTAHNSARFWDGGVIDNGDNLLESQQGTYYSKQKLAIFYQEVEMKNPDYLIRSDSLHYYTEREKAEFWGQTYLWGDSIFMASRYGYYDRPADLVFLAQRAYAQTAKQEAWSDSIQYYRRIRTGYFYGNIQVADTVQRAVLFGDYAKLTDNPQTALVTKQPSAALYGEKPSDDTMFVRADTFLSYNIPRSTMLQRARPDTLSAPEAPADAPAPEPPPLPVSYCETWHLPCSDNYALPYRYDRRERFAENTNYQRLHRRRAAVANVPYLPPLRASPDFAEQTAALLLADSVFALQMLDTLRQSPLFARYVGGLPLVDSLGKTASALAAHLDALQTLHHRDSLALADVQTLRAAEMQEMAALRSQRTEDSAAIADLQAAQNAHQQTISRLLAQRRADSAQTAALLAQHSRSEAFIHSLQYFRRRDSALIAGLRRRLAGDTTPAPPETPPIERLAAIYGLTFRSKTDSSTGLAYSPLDLPADSAPPDTAAQDTMVRHFIAYRNVRFFHKDMQGKCDSFIYIVSDSMGEMHRLPVVWSDNNQLSAERIDIRQKNSQIHQVELVESAFVAAADDTIRDFFNQIKGVNMLIHFANNDIYRMDVFSGGQTVYYMRDKGKLSGVQKGSSADIIIRLKNRQIQKIDYLQKPETRIIPPKDVAADEMMLNGFVWQSGVRPRSRWEICPRRIVPSFRGESAQIEQPKFPVFEQIIHTEKSPIPYRYPPEAGTPLKTIEAGEH